MGRTQVYNFYPTVQIRTQTLLTRKLLNRKKKTKM